MRRPRIGITSGSAPVPVAEGTLASHYVGLAYTWAIDSVGGVPVVLPAVEGHEEEDALELIGAVDGILLSGGTDIHPATYGQALDRERTHDPDTSRDRFELALVARAREAGLPILGVCRGLQLLNVAYGGTLDQHRPHRSSLRVSRTDLRIEETHLRVEPGTRTRAILGVDRLAVYCLHHQAVDRVGEGLVVTMRAADGLVEGLEDPSAPFVLGTLWHPEQTAHREAALRIYRALVEAAGRRHG